jgi:hypothetical protein
MNACKHACTAMLDPTPTSVNPNSKTLRVIADALDASPLARSFPPPPPPPCVFPFRSGNSNRGQSSTQAARHIVSTWCSACLPSAAELEHAATKEGAAQNNHILIEVIA